MPTVRHKTEKIKMGSYLEAATERLFEVVIFKAASRLDLTSLHHRILILITRLQNPKIIKI